VRGGQRIACFSVLKRTCRNLHLPFDSSKDSCYGKKRAEQRKVLNHPEILWDGNSGIFLFRYNLDPAKSVRHIIQSHVLLTPPTLYSKPNLNKIKTAWAGACRNEGGSGSGMKNVPGSSSRAVWCLFSFESEGQWDFPYACGARPTSSCWRLKGWKGCAYGFTKNGCECSSYNFVSIWWAQKFPSR